MSPPQKKSSLASLYFGSPTVPLAWLRELADRLELPWNHILEAVRLPKASLSRLKHGTAGPKTVELVFKAIQTWALERGRTHRQIGEAARQVDVVMTTDVDDIPPGQLHISRAVIVENVRGERFYGFTVQRTNEIVSSKAVQLSNFREITGKPQSLAFLATHGPTTPAYAKQIGPRAESKVLVLDVNVVHECTPDAVERFSRLPNEP